MMGFIRLLFSSFLLLMVNGVQADLYAKWAGWGDAWMKESGENGIQLAPPGAPILEMRHVGIPAYPGAKLTLIGPNGGNSDTACSLSLGTNDDVSKIIDFYQKTLDPVVFEFHRIGVESGMFLSKEKPDSIAVVVEGSAIEDQFGFNKRIVIQFEGLQGYKCTAPIE